MTQKYGIYRYYVRDDRFELRVSGLSWAQVQEILANPETKFDYATTEESHAITREHGPWWDLWKLDDDSNDGSKEGTQA